MSYNSNIIEVKKFFSPHPDGLSYIFADFFSSNFNLEDRNVLDGSKTYVKSTKLEPEKNEKMDFSAPVKLIDESMHIRNV